MNVKYKVFSKSGKNKKWETLWDQASEFASQISPDKLISISTASTTFGSFVTVWYWD